MPCRQFDTMFFDCFNRDDGRSWSTPFVIDDPTLYVVRGYEQLVAGYNRKEREKHKEFLNAVEKFKATSPAAPARAMVMFDNNNFNEPAVFVRGNPGRQGPKVERHFLSALSADKPLPLTEGSGRLQLARAIASPENPLTARVFVNRLWTALCGGPLVDTPADFGVRTAPPAKLTSSASTFAWNDWNVPSNAARPIWHSHTLS